MEGSMGAVMQLAGDDIRIEQHGNTLYIRDWYHPQDNATVLVQIIGTIEERRDFVRKLMKEVGIEEKPEDILIGKAFEMQFTGDRIIFEKTR
jgi:hypothetical protein